MAGDLDRPAPEPGLLAGPVLLEQDFDAGSLFSLRAAVAAHAAAAGLAGNRLYDVVTVAHELAANAVRHGAGHGRLRLGLDAGVLRCEVSDDGRPPVTDVTGGGGAAEADEGQAEEGQASDTDCNAPDAGIPVGTVAEADGEAVWPEQHGHGLWVIGQVADQFTIDRSPAATVATAAFALGAHANGSETAELATAGQPVDQGQSGAPGSVS